MKKLNLIMAALVVFAISSAWSKAEPRDQTHDIVTDDYFSIGVVSACAVSPSGRRIAWTEMRWEKDNDKRNTDIWVTSTDQRIPVRLTFDSASDTAPTWSPDERWVYFTSSRKRTGDEKAPYNGKRQIWRIATDGGDPFPLTRVSDGIGQYQLSGDGQALYYTVATKHVEEGEFKKLKEEYDDLTYGHGVDKFSELWKLDLRTWRTEKLVDDHRVITEFVVTPNDRRIAMLTTPTGELISNEGWSRVDVYDTATKELTTLPDAQWREQAPSPYGWLVNLAWSSDGDALAFRVDFDGYPGEIFVAEFGTPEEPKIQSLHRPDGLTVTGHMEWRPGRRDLCFIAEDHARARVHSIKDIRDGQEGAAVTLTPGDVCVDTFAISGNGEHLAMVMSDVTHPPDVFTLPADGRTSKYERITHVNPQVDEWKIPSIQTVQWKSTDGTDVEGILELPPGYLPGTALPMVVVIHGGPTASAKLRFRFWIYGRVLFPARGWAVLSPNYRGSTGYGDKFLTELIGHKNDRDVADILSGVDAMVERGIADPDKLAVMGWSNGGFLTNCVITHTTRFKAASSGAGVFETAMQWMIEDTPGHVINFNRGFPWSRTEAMLKTSALYNIDKAQTPTIIHVGENDHRVPQEHSRGLFRSLHQYLKVPTELVIYPGAGHGLTKYSHRKAKMEWDIRWFDHHVLGKPVKDDEGPGPAVD